jgi:CubicO group peptidase (beta-lactamase class C family)
VRVPERFGEPVTPHHLLTHTAGFENRFLGIAAADSAGTMPLGACLRENLPARLAAAWWNGDGNGWVWEGGSLALVASGVQITLLETWNLMGWWF